MYNPHYLRRSHTVFDNVQWLRETWPNPVFISAQDAQEKGIQEGDTVLITSPHGKCLRTACPTQRFMPGVIGLPHGAWVDMDEEKGIDRAGSDNILTGQIQSGQGVSGWNTCIGNIEKYQEELAPDSEHAPAHPRSADAGEVIDDEERILLRHDRLHRLQDVPGCVQGQERP